MNTENSHWLRVELHLHTHASADSLVTPQKLIAHCKKLGIDRVAVTDHNSINGALAAHSLAPDRIIVGEEVETTQGELLAYFVSEAVPAGLEPLETIQRLRAQGAVISVAHPFDQTRSAHWTYDQLSVIAPLVDAVEVFNARCLTQQPNQKAAAFALEHGLLGTVGSDAHSLMEVGRASLHMPPFTDAAGFLAALGKAQPHTRRSPVCVHLFSRWANFVNNFRDLSSH